MVILVGSQFRTSSFELLFMDVHWFDRQLLKLSCWNVKCTVLNDPQSQQKEWNKNYLSVLT